jgi:hypothetical protein
LFNNIKNPSFKTIRFLCLASDNILTGLETYSRGKPFVFVQKRKMRRRIPKANLIEQEEDVNSDSEYEDFDSELKFSDFELDFFGPGILDKILAFLQSLKSEESTLPEQKALANLFSRSFKQRPELFAKVRYLQIFSESLRRNSFHDELESVLLSIMEFILQKLSENKNLGFIFMLFSCSTQYFASRRIDEEDNFAEVASGENIILSQNLNELVGELISSDDTSILNWLLTKLSPLVDDQSFTFESSQEDKSKEPFYLRADNNTRKLTLNSEPVSKILNFLGLELEKQKKIWSFSPSGENRNKLRDSLKTIKELLDQDVANPEYDFFAPQESNSNTGETQLEYNFENESENKIPIEIEDNPVDIEEKENWQNNYAAMETDFSKRRKRMKFLLERNNYTETQEEQSVNELKDNDGNSNMDEVTLI